MSDGATAPHRGGLMSEKIHRRHRERAAIVYIRQSTPQQVERHQESTRLQYALVDRAFQLGWARETIIVIDDDLGRSGTTIEGRLGFQRLVAESANHRELDSKRCAPWRVGLDPAMSDCPLLPIWQSLPQDRCAGRRSRSGDGRTA